MHALPKPGNRRIAVSERLPQPDQLVIVITSDFRCLGYLDGNHVWRHHSNKSEIKGAIAWSEEA
jgi:hypothetical protein